MNSTHFSRRRMTLNLIFSLGYLLIVLVTCPRLLFAHPGHLDIGFLDGVFHPLTGMDHLLTAIAIGVLAVVFRSKSVTLFPAVFVGGLLTGSFFAVSQLIPNPGEFGITLSLGLLGSLLVFRPELPLFVSVCSVGIFGYFHGYAHGSELPANSAITPYLLGIALSTALAHGVGILAALSLSQKAGEFGWKWSLNFLGASLIVMCVVQSLQFVPL